MTVPHRNDVAGLATLRPDHNHQPAVEMARADETRLAVIAPVIHDRSRTAGKYFFRSRKIQTAMPER
jgi:hypothetical protein